MLSQKNVHWGNPTAMLLSMTCGFLLILLHHLFYASLDRDPVPTGLYTFAGRSLSKQQFNTSVGIALAFLVKTALCFAVSIAYVQTFWISLRILKEAARLTEIDWAYAGLENVFGLFNLKFGFKHPPLITLAFAFWCIPIATIFPPAALSVTSTPGIPTAMLEVPQFDFTSLMFSEPLKYVSSAGVLNDWYWSGPSQPLQHLALAVLGLGQMLPISPPAPNSTWKLDFWGPALQCNDVDGLEKNNTWINIWNSYNATTAGSYAYLSWAPWSYVDYDLWYDNLEKRGVERSHPFLLDVPRGPVCVGPPPSIVSTEGPLSFFVAVLPGAQVHGIAHSETLDPAASIVFNKTSCDWKKIQSLDETLTTCRPANAAPFTPALAFDNSSLIRCDLHNTSYSATFNFVGGVQDVQVSKDLTKNSPIVNGSKWFMAPHPPSIPDSQIVQGCTPFQMDPLRQNNGTACTFDDSAIRTLSYQSIMAAFNEVVLGNVQDKFDSVAVNTTVTKTVLADTQELAFLRNWDPSFTYSQFPNLYDLLSNRTEPAYSALLPSDQPNTGGSLKSNLEQLFQDYTLSLLSQPLFFPNYTSPFAPTRLTRVSLDTSSINYTYDRITLWVPYGIAMLFTAVSVIVGVTSIYRNGASFSNDFSTILRVSQRAELSVEIKDEDGVGSDPLPKYLKSARLNLRPEVTPRHSWKNEQTNIS